MRIGLFGGSFNPIHNGHIAVGSAMLKALKLDEVWYMVTPQNPLKRHATDLADEQVRLRLTEAALEEYPALKAKDYEFHLEKPSYTWNTLQHLKKDYPNDTFIIIIGGDNWQLMPKWAHHEEIMRDYEIAIYPREGIPSRDEQLPDNVYLVDVPEVDVTSTRLRQLIRNGEDISEFVPHNVVEEVKRKYLE